MPYSISSISTVEDCDVLLLALQKELATFNYRKTTLEYQRDNNAGRAAQLEVERQTLQVEINSLNTAIGNFPNGNSTRTELENKLTTSNYKLFQLNQRMSSFGQVAIILREVDLEQVNLSISELQAVMASVQTQRDSLIVP